MKQLLFLVVCLPLLCLAQIRTEHYTLTKTKYLELVEITDNLSGISKPVDSTFSHNAVDTLYYAFKLTPYPDQIKKYEIQSSLKVILTHKSDTFVCSRYKISNDSSYLSFVIPPQYDTYTLKIYVNTDYKRRWRKSLKHYSEEVVFNEINRVIETRAYCRRNRSGCWSSLSRYISPPGATLNETRKNHQDLSIDQLIIRTVPGVN